jgi:hypothetical protein
MSSARDRFFDECIDAWEEFMEARQRGETLVYYRGDDCNLDGRTGNKIFARKIHPDA